MKCDRLPQSRQKRANYNVLQNLRSEVSESHRLLHEVVVLEDFISSRASYINSLQLLYGVLMPLEQMIKPYFCRFPPRLRLESGLKTGWIEKDLLILGLTTDDLLALPMQRDLPKINSLADAVGALYVLEGSTVGAKIMYTKILNELHFGPQNGARYFYGYGDQQMQKWEDFLVFLDDFVREEPKRFPSVSRFACRVFESFRLWFLFNKKRPT